MTQRTLPALAAALIVLAACATPQAPPAARTPPPLPRREALGVNFEGRVVDAASQPVPMARVRVRAMDVTCTNVANSVTIDRGEFAGFIEFGVGPASPGCVTIEARAAGSRAVATHQVIYGAEDDPENLIGGELILPRVELTEERAAAIVEEFRQAFHRVDPNSEAEIATYFGVPTDELRPRLNDLRRHLRGIDRVEPLGGFRYRLRGAAGRTHEIRIVPGALPRIEL